MRSTRSRGSRYCPGWAISSTAACVNCGTPSSMRFGAAEAISRSERQDQSVHEFLERLECGNAHLLAGRFCLEHHFFAVERIDTLTRLCGRFLHDFHLQKSRQRKQAVTAQTLLDRGGKRVKHGSDLLLGELCFLRNASENFRLGRCCILFRHIKSPAYVCERGHQMPANSTRRRK